MKITNFWYINNISIKRFILFARSISLMYMIISESYHSQELHSENLLSYQCIIDHMQSADLDAISHFHNLSNNWSRLLLPERNPLTAKVFDANTRERILQLQSISSVFFCSLHYVKVSCNFFDRNQMGLLKFFNNIIWHYNNFASPYIRD